jgi:hypothetical protein
MPRSSLAGILILAALLHALGMARSPLPAQDGLKFIRIARQFQEQPWVEVVRRSDQHPLYPALVAIAEPCVRLVAGWGPSCWRIAAQSVSALASLWLLIPLFRLVQAWFNESIAATSTLLWVLLPVPGLIGHDTLSDSLFLALFVTALWFGDLSLRDPSRLTPGFACGLTIGLGFLTRPEALVLPISVCLVSLARWLHRPNSSRVMIRAGTMMISFLVVVGCYSLVKGQVSEKLALRRAVGLPPSAVARPSLNPLPPGLDDPRWDFSPKEEAHRSETLSPSEAFLRLVRTWAENLVWVLAIASTWGFWRSRNRPERRLAAVFCLIYCTLFGAILVRHATVAGYLSDRHTLSIALVTLPWSAVGISEIRQAIRSRLRPRRGLVAMRVALLASVVLAAAYFQVRDGHPTRWGHRAAGEWLARHLQPGEAVLDTRGWAAFVSDTSAYSPWQFGQALRDPNLTYLVVGTDELKAPSRRAMTLRALLRATGSLVVGFSGRQGGEDVAVQIYRVHPPRSWRGLLP